MTFTDRPNGLPHCPSTRAKYLVRLGSHIEVYINSTSLDVRPRTPARHRSERREIATHSRPARSIRHATALSSLITSGIVLDEPAPPGVHAELPTASGFGIIQDVHLRELGIFVARPRISRH